jgi:hypothetical protein
MRIIFILLGFVLILATFQITFSQGGQSALPFLLAPTSSEMHGMGYASVASITDDPLASTRNPGQLGLQSIYNNFSFGYNYSDWLPSFKLDLWLKTYAINAGINLQKYKKDLPPLSIGIGYSQVYMNYGEFIQTNEYGPDVLGRFKSYDKSDQLTLSIAADYFINASLGITYKHINSNLSGQIRIGDITSNGTATANLYDWGILVYLPVVTVLSKLLEQPLKIVDDLYPDFGLSFGFMNGNLGQNSIYYFNPVQPDLLPRIVRTGIGLNLGINIIRNNNFWKPISFRWTLEANDLLIKAVIKNDSSYLVYQSGFGDIDFFKEIIKGKTNPITDKLKGWQLNIFETFTLEGGRFEEDPLHGNRHFDSWGWSLRSGGILKSFSVFMPNLLNKNLLEYILKHIDIRYGVSLVETDVPDHPLNNTRFQTLNIILTN